MFKYEIDSLTFSSADEINLESNSLTSIIGPNSAGKSTALREIQTILRGYPGKYVIKSLKNTKDGDAADFENWLSKNYPSKIVNAEKVYFMKGHVINKSQIANSWGDIRQSYQFLCSHLDTKSRLDIASTKQAINPFQQTPTEFIHILQTDSALAKDISDEIKASFDDEIIINWGGAAQVFFHVGKEPKRTKENDRVSPEFIES